MTSPLQLGNSDKAFLQQLLLVIKEKRKSEKADIQQNFSPNGYFIVLFDEQHGTSSAVAKGFVNCEQIQKVLNKLLVKIELDKKIGGFEIGS